MRLVHIARLHWFEWTYQRSLGLLPVLFFFVTLWLVTRTGLGLDARIQLVHTLYLPWIAWSSLLYFQPLYDIGAYDTLIPYYRKWVGFHAASFVIFYSGGYLVLLSQIDGAFPLIRENAIVLAHHALLLLLYGTVGASLIVWMKSFEYAATIFVTYTLIEIVTRGEFMPWPHIFYFNSFYDDPMYLQKVGMVAVLTLLASAVFLVKLYKRT